MTIHGIQNSDPDFLAVADGPARIASTNSQIIGGGRLKSRGRLPDGELGGTKPQSFHANGVEP